MRLPWCLSAVALSGILVACAGTEESPHPAAGTGVVMSGIIIRNSLAFPVTDVMVQAPATGRFAGCGNIQPRTACKTSFPAIGYRDSALIVTWRERGEPQATDEFAVKLPDSAQSGDSLWLEVIIYSAGLAGAKLVQP